MSILQVGVDAFNESMDAALAEHPDKQWRVSGKPTKSQPNGEDEFFWRNNAPGWLTQYYHWRMSNPQLQIWTLPGTDVPAIEVEVAVKVPGTDINVKGFIDRIFHNLETDGQHIVDLKSGKNPQTSPLQLCFYRLAIREQFGVDIRYGSYYDARSGGLDAIYDLDQFPPELVSKWIRNMARAVEAREFTPNIGKHCTWCSHKPDCYVWSSDVPRPEVDDAQ